MILVDSISRLQQNNLGLNEQLYYEPIVTAKDVILQGYLPKQIQNDYTIEVHLMSADGDSFIKDITDSFKFLFGSAKNYYFNAEMQSFDFDNDFFTLKIIVKNAGFLVYSKITEPYQRLSYINQCYAVIDDFAMMIINKSGYIKINDVIYSNGDGLQPNYEVNYINGHYYIYVNCDDVVMIGYCYNDDDVLIDVPLTADIILDKYCSQSYIRLEATYNCEDDITGEYFGDPKNKLNFANNEDIKFRKSTYISCELLDLPTEIKKIINFQGKAQRVEYVKKFELKGLSILPLWKMNEIEAIFSGRRIFLNGVEYIFRGGKVFQKDTIKNTNSWILSAELENPPKVNDFSCIEDCTIGCYYYVIFGGNKDQPYYNENKELIAYTFSELIQYFNNLNDVNSVTELLSNQLECDVVGLIQVDTDGTLPAFIYFNTPTPQNKVFIKYTDCQDPKNLCDGISTCKKPEFIQSSMSVYIGCATPPSFIQSSMTEEESDFVTFTPTPLNGWEILSYNFKKYNDRVKMEFYAQKQGLTDNMQFDEPIFSIEPTHAPIINHYDDFADVYYSISTAGEVTGAGHTTNGAINLTTEYNI